MNGSTALQYLLPDSGWKTKTWKIIQAVLPGSPLFGKRGTPYRRLRGSAIEEDKVLGMNYIRDFPREVRRKNVLEGTNLGSALRESRSPVEM